MFKMTRTYRKWDSMIARCHRPSHPAFKYYGARGIQVCDRWRADFKAFLADLGEAPEGLWLDRIDNARGYEPGNCRWVTPKQSAANRTGKGGPPINPGSIRQRAKVAGLPYMLVYLRLRRGWSLDKALSIPVLARGGITDYEKRRLGLLD